MGVEVTAFRTEISDCEATTNWAGGTIATNDAFNLEGTFCLGSKVSQTTGAEHMYTFPGANPNMTNNFIVIPMQVTGTPDTVANGGYRMLVEDGNTDRGTWYVGGNDTTNAKWGYFVLDPTTAPDFLNGVANNAKAVTSITRVGAVATVTTTAGHGLVTGDAIIMAGAAVGYEGYNAWSLVTVLTATTFTYSPEFASPTPASGTWVLKQGVDASDVDQVGCQFKVLSKSVGNTPNALWDICWYGNGLKVTSTIDSVTITRSGSTVTVTSTAHGLVVGDKVRIAGATQTDYNGDWTITAVNLNDYDFDIGALTPTTPATGTITARVHATWQHIVDADAAGYWGLIVQEQGVNFMQGRFVLGSFQGADDLLFVDSGFKCIFRENFYLPAEKNSILPAKDLTGDTIDIEWSNGIISAFITDYGFNFDFADFALNTFTCSGMTFENVNTFTSAASSLLTYTNCIWTGAFSLEPKTSTLTGCQFINARSDSLGMVWPTSGNTSDMQFLNNTYSVYITQTVNQTFDNLTFDDLGTDVYLFNGSVDIDVSNTNGSNANSYVDGEAGGGVVTFTNAQTVEVTGLSEGAAAVMIANETVGTITSGDVIFELLADSTGTAGIATFNYEGAFDPSGLDVIIRARQQGLPNYAISEDNGTFVDETTNANSATVDDMLLLVDTAPVAGQDWYYLGHAEQFNRLKLDVSTAMAGGALLDFEYWNGAWTNLSGVVDGTSNYTNTGESMITFTLPGDWATTSVDGNGPAYYIRIGYLSGTVTTAPRGRKCKLDVTRYLPFVQNNTITSTGLSATASWAVDSIAKFDSLDT